jgi:hypothetical protein
MEQSKKKKTVSTKTYLPWVGLIVLTIILMVIFKFTEQGYSDIQEKGENILAQYTRNLSPLYSKTDLTDEDVFNFALYNKLPIDKRNKKILSLESNSYGNEELEILKTESDFDTENYIEFKTQLALDANQEEEIDSLVNSYKNDIYATILQNEEEVIAIDPKISLLHKALSAEIYDFALNRIRESKSEDKTSQFASAIPSRNMQKKFNREKVDMPQEFIVLTPDTVFSSKFTSDPAAKSEDSRIVSQFNPATDVFNSSKEAVIIDDFNDYYTVTPIPEFNFHFSYDSTNKKLVIPSELFTNTYDLVYDSLQLNLENLSSELESMNFNFGTSENGFNFSFNNKEESVNLDFDISNLGDFINQTIQMSLSASMDNDWEKFGHKMDSLAQVISDLENDSAAIIKLKMLSKELEKRKKTTKKKID